MIEFDPRRDRLLSSLQAPQEAKLSERQFGEYARQGSRLPVYLLPPVARRGVRIERYLNADLRVLAGGALS
jgi:hypothetical protein